MTREDDPFEHGREEGLRIGAGEPPELAEQHEREIEGRLAGDTSSWDPATREHVSGYLAGLRAAERGAPLLRPAAAAIAGAGPWRRSLLLAFAALLAGILIGRALARRANHAPAARRWA